MRKQRECLENKADISIFRRDFVNTFIPYVDFATVRFNEPSDEPQKRGFAAAAWP
jgi:hypothetical protein